MKRAIPDMKRLRSPACIFTNTHRHTHTHIHTKDNKEPGNLKTVTIVRQLKNAKLTVNLQLTEAYDREYVTIKQK